MYKQTAVKVDGKEIACYEKGSGAQTFIFMCGWGVPFALTDMFHLSDAVADSCRAIVVDRFGAGYSELTKRKRCVENVIDEYKCVCDALGVKDNLTIVGHSYGTYLAICFAAKYREMCKGMVLIDSVPRFDFLGKIEVSKNWLPASLVILFKKIGLINLLIKLKGEEIMFGKRDIPPQYKAETISFVQKKVYNKNVQHELKFVRNQLKLVQSSLSSLGKLRTVCICRDATYKQNLKFKNYLENVQIINVGKSPHTIHYYHPHTVAEIVKSMQEF